MTLVPAYSRDYKSKKAVLEDFNADKDFKVADLFSSGYTNKADLIRMGVKSVNIRYQKLTKIIVVSL